MKFKWRRWAAIVAGVAAVVLLASGCVVNGSWSQVEVTDPASPQTGIVWLSKVSCPTSSFCAAVGTGQFGPVWATWTGDKWGVIPFGARDDEIYDVSCISSTQCYVTYLKFDPVTDGQHGRVDEWDGSSFAPAITDSVSLPAVSCSPDGYCLAVGSGKAWVLEGDGFVLRPVTAPAAQAISCVSSSFCMSVATTYTAGPGEVEVVQTWDGTNFTSVALPSASARYRDVSCASSSFCELVGADGDPFPGQGTAVVSRWDGSKLVAESVPTSPGQVLNAVSCTSRWGCVSMHNDFALDSHPDAYATNGVSWYKAPAPPAPGGTFDQYNDIDCLPGSTWCMAVGGSREGLNYSELAATYRWTDPSPNSVLGAR